MAESENRSPQQPLQAYTDHGFRSMAVMTAKGLDKSEIVRVLAGQLITVAAMADASSLSIVSLSKPHAVMNAKGLDKAEIVHVLAGQLITVASMADASSLSIVSLSEHHVPSRRHFLQRALIADFFIVLHTGI
ncbi:hypothetical protein Tco_0901979 [Tanacetum coccineum]